MSAQVRCRHLATLDAEPQGLGVCSHPACGPALTKGRWTFAGRPEDFGHVLAELAEGCSLGGALLRVAESRRPGQPLFLADGEQIAVATLNSGVFRRTLGGGAYAVAAIPVVKSIGWTVVPVGTHLLLDPCGVTATILTAAAAARPTLTPR